MPRYTSLKAGTDSSTAMYGYVSSLEVSTVHLLRAARDIENVGFSRAFPVIETMTPSTEARVFLPIPFVRSRRIAIISVWSIQDSFVTHCMLIVFVVGGSSVLGRE